MRKEAWMPKRGKAPRVGAQVPARFRGLKLRKRRARYRDGSWGALVLVALVIAAVALVVAAYGRYVS